ncbi:MAG TPA: hypothetical protein ENH94_07970 [Phycisphaerales bacterium]|nr:hypothetical protein [Phycisphaerales bacterium]
MKNNTILSLLSAVFLLTVIFTAGCEEANKFSDKRAMLVGNENLQLKDQIKQKDSEIKALNKQIEDLKDDIVKGKEKARASVEQVTKAVTDIMGIFAETTKKAAKLETENAQLKKQLEQLK